ncbi:3'(2'),5'-bisphosphate nucleotidase CysQ [Desulfonema magnum]|uniref:3'(2'),5'-bisphosphate nucleotidase CysQ n=1 Tax=Desulfonema magnum TaxID=45655 RepID=A0A975GRW2_9BACT|nr:3'(2'),5'-bisphosphate nucleotidase CysQ [Desulfonema magnum]QTA91302.1 3'-phosphoadenosine 5'-phosphate phosphatase [Desulfonema magnum]
MRYEKYLLMALAASKIAGNAILDVYEQKIDVEYKKDQSPLTLADKRSHEIITKILTARAENPLPVLSEEGKNIAYEERKKWEYFWLTDPLDGTKEFIKRNGEFTVNIAIIHKNAPVLGVIYVPVKDVCYFAAEGLGSYKLDNCEVLDRLSEKAISENAGLMDEIISHSVILPTDRIAGSPFTIVGSRSHSTNAVEDFVADMKTRHEAVEFISAGSSLKLCLVAEGKADVYPRLAPTMEWDTAAGQVIVEQSGGNVLNAETNKPLQYNKENLLNPWFIVNRRNHKIEN